MLVPDFLLAGCVILDIYLTSLNLCFLNYKIRTMRYYAYDIENQLNMVTETHPMLRKYSAFLYTERKSYVAFCSSVLSGPVYA